MATFGRSGHFRTNRNGTTFWVRGHDVSRDSWTSSIPRPVTKPYDFSGIVANNGNITIPNARCPKCGDPVFFFMSASGGRVFFDDLGPPWPKHPCTISEDAAVRWLNSPPEIQAWIVERQSRAGTQPSLDRIGLQLGYDRGRARVIRRDDKDIIFVETTHEDCAYFAAEIPLNIFPTTVYFKRDENGIVNKLEFLTEELEAASISVKAIQSFDDAMSTADIAYAASIALNEIKIWSKSGMPYFSYCAILKILRFNAGLFGYIGKSRAAVIPVSAFFDEYFNYLDDDQLRYNAAKDQIMTWSPKILQIMNQSKKSKKHPLYQDLFVWILPEHAFAYQLENLITNISVGTRKGSDEITSIASQPIHHVVHIGSSSTEPIYDAPISFDMVIVKEKSFIIAGSKITKERKWLDALIDKSGLTQMLLGFKNEGVYFEFKGTLKSQPSLWGYQAVLPDGRSKLVLLHLSRVELGVAFAVFESPKIDDYDEHHYALKRIVYAFNLSNLLMKLALPDR